MRSALPTALVAGWLAAAAAAPVAAEGVFVEEREPNGSAAAATPLGAARVRARGQIFPAGDVDYWSFPASAGDRVYAAAMTASSSPDLGCRLDVRAADGTTILENDDDNGTFGSNAPSIAGVVIPASGTYFLRVFGEDATREARPYHLYLQLRSGAPEPEVEPNDVSAQALPAGRWVSGVAATATDVDRYTFDLDAGDVVFLSLDLDPERDDTDNSGGFWNGQVGLGLFDGLVLLANDLNTPGPDSEAFFMKVPTSGTYVAYVAVGGGTAPPNSTYHLSVSVHPAVEEGINCTTYSSGAVSLPIPSLSSVVSTVVIPGQPRIADLDVSIRLDHPDMSHLDVHLVSPAGNDNGLFSDVGSVVSPDAMNLTLDDEAGTPPFSVLGNPIVFQPEAPYRLSWFDGEDAGGTWSLVIHDDNAGNDGTLIHWSLRVCEPAPPEPCPAGYVPMALYATDFESDIGGFTHSGMADEWAWGTPSYPPVKTTCHSGASCWATDLVDAYDANSSQDLLSPVIPLSATFAPPIVVSWAQRYQIDDAGSDHYSVDVQEAGGANPTRLFEWLDGTMTDTMGNPPVTLHESAGWGLVRRRIDAYAGQDVQLRFHLDSNASLQYAGVAIDDVRVTACGPDPDPIFRDGFE
jgi:subtilisin-like proprotein convertase family protein